MKPIAPIDSVRIAQLIRDLDHRKFTVRKKASDELEKLSDVSNVVEPMLRETLQKKPPLEVAQRIEELLTKARTLSPEQLRLLRAVEVLEHIGGPEACRVLDVLARGAPGAHLTRDARAARQRIAQRRAVAP
jgi:hypothetical protein